MTHQSIVDPSASVAKIVEEELLRVRGLADAEYEREMRRWRHKMVVAEGEFKDRLADQSFVESLDLPFPLPAFTVKILKRTMAGDKVGPFMPSRYRIYQRYGIGHLIQHQLPGVS